MTTKNIMRRVETGFHDLKTGSLFTAISKNPERSWDKAYYVMSYDLGTQEHALARVIPDLSDRKQPELLIQPMEAFDAEYDILQVLDPGNPYEVVGDQYILMNNPMNNTFEVYDGDSSIAFSYAILSESTYQISKPVSYKNATVEQKVEIVAKAVEIARKIQAERAAAQAAAAIAAQSGEKSTTLSASQLQQLETALDKH